ncbi:LysR family transcriptional regulator [Actinoplanes sp. SE50/110]|uniref:helix-turn-helix domain-containing protein n=1 Tax=unclassified Actinoplanes TaxID=2626549 RepID=UPI00350F600E
MSRATSRLERRLGVTLLDRDHHGARLTKAGAVVMPVGGDGSAVASVPQPSAGRASKAPTTIGGVFVSRIPGMAVPPATTSNFSTSSMWPTWARCPKAAPWCWPPDPCRPWCAPCRG